jgi:hypothetical protein
MEDYLLNHYDSELQLIPESPVGQPNRYWLYSDNYLASLSLEGSSPETSSNIQQAILSYNPPPQQRFEVITGGTLDPNAFAYDRKQFPIDNIDGKEVWSETIDHSDPMNDWQEFADRLLLAAINQANLGDYEQAEHLFNLASEMFDGIGFRDKAFQDDRYETYKLALYLIAAEKIGVEIENEEKVRDTILELQGRNPDDSLHYGGVYTHCTSDLIPAPEADTNTETTSLCLIALTL